MAPGPSVIYEYDPATGMTVPRDANELFMEDNVPAPPPAPAEPAPTWLQGRRQRRSMAAGAPPHGAMAKSAGARRSANSRASRPGERGLYARFLRVLFTTTALCKPGRVAEVSGGFPEQMSEATDS